LNCHDQKIFPSKQASAHLVLGPPVASGPYWPIGVEVSGRTFWRSTGKKLQLFYNFFYNILALNWRKITTRVRPNG
jgi:hypothetical protein